MIEYDDWYYVVIEQEEIETIIYDPYYQSYYDIDPYNSLP